MYIRLIGLLPLVLLLTGCNDIVMSAQEAGENPSKMLGALATFGTSVALLLFIFSERGIWRTILDSIIVTGMVALIFSPFFYTTEEPERAYMLAASGGMGVVIGLLVKLVDAVAGWLRRLGET